jgi:hypothetical protein
LSAFRRTRLAIVTELVLTFMASAAWATGIFDELLEFKGLTTRVLEISPAIIAPIF